MEKKETRGQNMPAGKRGPIEQRPPTDAEPMRQRFRFASTLMKGMKK